jgi:hypothetical protein
MTAWDKDQSTSGSMLKLLGDPRSEFTNALGLVLDHPGPMSVLGNPRCKRFSMLVDDGVIKSLNVAASDDDPAGDNAPQVSMVDKMLEDVKGVSAYGGRASARGPSVMMPGFVRPASVGAAQLSPKSMQSPTRPLGGYNVRPALARPMPTFARPRLDEESPDGIDIKVVALAGLLFCSGVTFAVVRLRRRASTENEQPFLEA